MKWFWRWLMSFAARRLDEEFYVVPSEFRELTSVAGKICAKAEAAFPGSHLGEFRRHHVFAAMIKAFPAIRRRHLALAIEVALNRVDSATP